MTSSISSSRRPAGRCSDLILEDLVRFRALTDSTPARRAHERRELDRLADAIALAVEDRALFAGAGPDDPEPVAVAAATTGLWRVFYRSLSRALSTTTVPEPAQVQRQVREDLARARAVLERGL